jgi:phosphatidylinositol 4-kinase B
LIYFVFIFINKIAPGKAFSMERAPWKLNQEFVDVMGGMKSKLFAEYRQRCIQVFNVARRHAKQVITLLEIMQYHSNYPAFKFNPRVIADYRSRLFMEHPETDVPQIIDRLIRGLVQLLSQFFNVSYILSDLSHL